MKKKVLKIAIAVFWGLNLLFMIVYALLEVLHLINKSKQNELTIVSFNIRNLGARQRSLKDFAGIADLLDESDVVMIQEAGLGEHPVHKRGDFTA